MDSICIEEYKDDTEKKAIVKNILNDLSTCKLGNNFKEIIIYLNTNNCFHVGIQNIIFTYENDINFTSRMNTLLQTVDMKLDKYKSIWTKE